MKLKKLVCLAAVAFACCGAGIKVCAMEEKPAVESELKKNKKPVFCLTINCDCCNENGYFELMQSFKFCDKAHASIWYSPKVLNEVCPESGKLKVAKFRIFEHYSNPKILTPRLEVIENKEKAVKCDGKNSGKIQSNLPIFGYYYGNEDGLCGVHLPSIGETKKIIDYEYEQPDGVYKYKNKNNNIIFDKNFEFSPNAQYVIQILDENDRVIFNDFIKICSRSNTVSKEIAH